MVNVTGPYPPAIFLDVMTNRRYILTGGPWVQISDDVRIEDINWINSNLKYLRQKDVTIKVKGSKGDEYSVTKFANGDVVCDCMGFSFRKTCKHLAMVK